MGYGAATWHGDAAVAVGRNVSVLSLFSLTRDYAHAGL